MNTEKNILNKEKDVRRDVENVLKDIIWANIMNVSHCQKIATEPIQPDPVLNVTKATNLIQKEIAFRSLLNFQKTIIAQSTSTSIRKAIGTMKRQMDAKKCANNVNQVMSSMLMETAFQLQFKPQSMITV